MRLSARRAAAAPTVAANPVLALGRHLLLLHPPLVLCLNSLPGAQAITLAAMIFACA
jgi:hypothetical protein